MLQKIYTPLQLPYEFDPDIEPIFGFRGIYEFLSNFYVHPVLTHEGILPSSEHAYMIQKDSDPRYKERIRKAKTPKQAKRIGYSAILPPDWDESRKFYAMHKALKYKFCDPELAQWLLNTGDRYLEETNFHGDTIWGRCNGIGSNHLGRQLMVIRYMLKTGQLKIRT